MFEFNEVNGVIQNDGVAPEDNHTVWPDTVPVLNFAHYIKDGLGGGAQFDPSSQPSGEPWFGSSRLKYAYRLDNVTLRERGGANVSDPSGDKLLSGWAHSPSRSAADSSEVSPSGAEVTNLQLLNNDPFAWARSSANGGEGQPGDPATIITTLCDPVPPPRRACLFGSDAVVTSLSEARLRRSGAPQGPYPSKFLARSEGFSTRNGVAVTGAALNSMLASQGLSMRGGSVEQTPSFNINGNTFSKVYRLPSAQTVTADNISPVALEWRANLDRDVTDGELTLLVCQDDNAGDNTSKCYMFEDARIGSRSAFFDFDWFEVMALRDNSPMEVSDRIDITRPSDPRVGSDG
ncbi:MAG: hypothetical protein KAG66_01140, partial [Methylococcales bacterium]|nr:hypothetical protein [Methylococcales bacterium]